jgi:hypothetical protein
MSVVDIKNAIAFSSTNHMFLGIKKELDNDLRKAIFTVLRVKTIYLELMEKQGIPYDLKSLTERLE